MAVDTCRGEKPQPHQPKMLEDGQKVALMGGVIVHFAIGPSLLEGGRFCFCPTFLNIKYFASVPFAVSDSRRAKVCGQGKVGFRYPSHVSLVNSYSKCSGKSLLYSSTCLMGSVAERSKALV